MRTSRWLVLIAGVAGVFDVSACGPDFPLMLTTCRSRCLASVTAPEFEYNAVRAGSADPRLAGQEGMGPTTVGLEVDGLDDDAQASITAMRRASTGDEAYALGKSLPEAARLYTAGAVDFNSAHYRIENQDEESDSPEPISDADQQALNAALQRFQQILKLPAAEASSRILWANFMVGRCYALRKQPGDLDLALAAFQRTVELVRQGADDPMGLGHAALGEAGRVALDLGHPGEAVKFYAEQAVAPEPGSAIESLRFAVSALLKEPAPLDAWVRDPVVQKALIAYVIVQFEHYQDNICVPSLGCEPRDQSVTGFGPSDDPAIGLLAALDKLDVKQVQWPDQVAGIAYRLQKYTLVNRVLAVSNTPYADWMRAKMALHAGDLQAAAAAFARASKGFATIDPSSAMSADLVKRVQGEQGLVSLARNDFIEAFNQLSASGFEDDALYIAERVLTVEELQRLVDKQNLATAYRDLLARRLTRAGREAEALAYYGSDEVRDLAKNYLRYLQQAQQAQRPQSRAEGWYQAAVLEINSGMELRGAEKCPDFFQYGGDAEQPCSLEGLPRDLNSDEEMKRVADSAIQPNTRFHYRGLAVEHLMKAADNLPRRSATFDAVLCQGVHLLQQHGRDMNAELIHKLYVRYTREGHAEAWAKDFGSEGPEPVFE